MSQIKLKTECFKKQGPNRKKKLQTEIWNKAKRNDKAIKDTSKI